MRSGNIISRCALRHCLLAWIHWIHWCGESENEREKCGWKKWNKLNNTSINWISTINGHKVLHFNWLQSEAISRPVLHADTHTAFYSNFVHIFYSHVVFRLVLYLLVFGSFFFIFIVVLKLKCSDRRHMHTHNIYRGHDYLPWIYIAMWCVYVMRFVVSRSARIIKVEKKKKKK